MPLSFCVILHVKNIQEKHAPVDSYRLLHWWVWGNKFKQWFWQQCQQFVTTIYLIICPSDIISWAKSSRQVARSQYWSYKGRIWQRKETLLAMSCLSAPILPVRIGHLQILFKAMFGEVFACNTVRIRLLFLLGHFQYNLVRKQGSFSTLKW